MNDDEVLSSFDETRWRRDSSLKSLISSLSWLEEHANSTYDVYMLLITICLKMIAVCLVIIAACLVTIRVILPRPCLLALPYSHYVELARWSLQRRDMEFTELRMPIGPHAMVFSTIRLLFPGGLCATSSFPGQSVPQRGHWWSVFTSVAWIRRLSGTPALITKEGRILPDSWGILQHCGFEIDGETRELFDTVLGPSVRQFAYHNVFSMPGAYRRLQSSGPFEMYLFDVIERLFRVSQMMRPLMAITPEHLEKAVGSIREIFGSISTTLCTAPYLGNGGGSEHFGGADLAFAALGGWLLLPPNMHAGAVDMSQWADLTKFPEQYQQLYAELKETRAGRHVLKLYEEERHFVELEATERETTAAVAAREGQEGHPHAD